MMKINDKTKDLTYAAMMVAIFIVMHFICPANNRGIQSALGIITPIPIAVYCTSYNSKKIILMGAAGILMTLLFFEPIMIISFIIPNMILGIVLGTFLRRGISLGKLIIVAILCIGFNLYELYINYLVTGVDFIELNVATIDASVSGMKKVLPQINEQILRDLNISLLPLFFIGGGVIKTLAACYVTAMIAERMGVKSFNLKDFDGLDPESYGAEAVMLSVYALTLVIWALVISGIIGYVFAYSVVLDICIVVVFSYYAVIHKTITAHIRDNRVKYLCVTFINMGLFFVISPVYAIKKIIRLRRQK